VHHHRCATNWSISPNAHWSTAAYAFVTKPTTSPHCTDADRLLQAGVKMTLRDLARRWKALDAEVKTLNQHIATLVNLAAPELVELFRVGVELTGQFLVTAGDNPDRIRNEKAFAKLYGVAPEPASCGRTTGRHRVSRSGDR
jgi:transposase